MACNLHAIEGVNDATPWYGREEAVQSGACARPNVSCGDSSLCGRFLELVRGALSRLALFTVIFCSQQGTKAAPGGP